MSTRTQPEKRLEWEKRIHQQRASGLSIERWCRENRIKSPHFHYWRDRLFPKTKRISFAEIPAAKDTGISIRCGSLYISLESSFDSAALKRFLSTLMEMKC